MPLTRVSVFEKAKHCKRVLYPLRPWSCRKIGKSIGLARILYVLVGVTSLHGDVIYLGKESYWHVADRILAQTLIMANVRQSFKYANWFLYQNPT